MSRADLLEGVRISGFNAWEEFIAYEDLSKITKLLLVEGEAKDLPTLCQKLRLCTSLKVLWLTSNSIGASGARAVCEVLPSLTELEELDFSGNHLGAEGCEALCAVLPNLSNLTSLHLGGNRLGPAEMAKICPGLSHMAHLISLNLSENELGDDGAAILSEVLPRLKNLIYLYLGVNMLRDEGVIALCKGVRLLPSLRVLWLRGNLYGDSGLRAAVALIPACSFLEKLWLDRFLPPIASLIVGVLIASRSTTAPNVFYPNNYCLLDHRSSITASLPSRMRLERLELVVDYLTAFNRILPPVPPPHSALSKERIVVDWMGVELSSFPELAFVDIGGCLQARGLDDIRSFLTRLRACDGLQHLNLTYAPLDNDLLFDFATTLRYLPCLKYLYLGAVSLSVLGIQSICQSFPQLVLLKVLDLSWCSLALEHLLILQPMLKTMTGLRELNLSGNCFDLSCVSLLNDLEASLSSLGALSLSENFFNRASTRALCDSFLPSVSQYQFLNFGGKEEFSGGSLILHPQIIKVLGGHLLSSSGLSMVKYWCLHHAITTLELRGNNLTFIPEEFSLCATLEKIDVRDNKLTSLPRWIVGLPALKELRATNNPLLSPPAPLLESSWDPADGLKIIKDYFLALDKSGCSEYYRFKLVVVGDAMAGKTSLIRTVMNQRKTLTAPNERTRLVEMMQLSLDTEDGLFYQFRVHDFGGQDHFRVVQSLFVGKGLGEARSRTVYLLVVPLDENPSKESIASWLNCIQYKTTSTSFPVIVVASKLALCRDWRLCAQRMKDLCAILDELHLHRNVLEFDPSDGGCLEDLRHAMLMMASRLPSSKEIIPASWISFVEFLDHIQENHQTTMSNKFIMSVDALFLLLCDSPSPNKPSFSTPDELRAALSFAHSLGLVFYFSGSPCLRNIVFLHPQWVADVCKTFIRHDFSQLLTTELKDTAYPAGSVQFRQDISQLLSSGLLFHRLLPTLIWFRIQELKEELRTLLLENSC